MKEIIIYEYQLKQIIEVLRLSSILHNCSTKKTCYDRQVTKAKEMAENCLNGEKDRELINKW